MATERHWCPKTVGDSTMRGHPCGRPASVERAGKWWCTQHDPEAVKARREARDRARDEQWAAERAERERQAAHRAERERLADAAEGLLTALRKLYDAEISEDDTNGDYKVFWCRLCGAEGRDSPRQIEHEASCVVAEARAAIAAAEGGTEEGA